MEYTLTIKNRIKGEKEYYHGKFIGLTSDEEGDYYHFLIDNKPMMFWIENILSMKEVK